VGRGWRPTGKRGSLDPEQEGGGPRAAAMPPPGRTASGSPSPDGAVLAVGTPARGHTPCACARHASRADCAGSAWRPRFCAAAAVGAAHGAAAVAAAAARGSNASAAPAPGAAAGARAGGGGRAGTVRVLGWQVAVALPLAQRKQALLRPAGNHTASTSRSAPHAAVFTAAWRATPPR